MCYLFKSNLNGGLEKRVSAIEKELGMEVKKVEAEVKADVNAAATDVANATATR